LFLIVTPFLKKEYLLNGFKFLNLQESSFLAFAFFHIWISAEFWLPLVSAWIQMTFILRLWLLLWVNLFLTYLVLFWYKKGLLMVSFFSWTDFSAFFSFLNLRLSIFQEEQALINWFTMPNCWGLEGLPCEREEYCISILYFRQNYYSN